MSLRGHRKNGPASHGAGARSEFFFGGASRVPWGWRGSYGRTGNFGRVGDKSMFKMYEKAGVGRVGDI